MDQSNKRVKAIQMKVGDYYAQRNSNVKRNDNKYVGGRSEG